MNSSINNNVNLGGEQRISGVKYFLQNICRKLSVAFNSTPSSTINSGYTIKDVNNNMVASFQGIKYATGTNRAQMEIIGNSGTSRAMYVQEDNSGKVTYQYGQSVGSNYIKIPRSSGVAVLFCWGYGNGSTSQTITFPSAFNNTSAKVLITTNGSNAESYQVITGNITATNFVAKAIGGASGQGFCWFAIGTADM